MICMFSFAGSATTDLRFINGDLCSFDGCFIETDEYISSCSDNSLTSQSVPRPKRTEPRPNLLDSEFGEERSGSYFLGTKIC